MKSSVFPFTLSSSQAEASGNCPLFAQIAVQCMNRHPWATAVTPWEKKPECSDYWPVPTFKELQEGLMKERIKSNTGDICY